MQILYYVLKVLVSAMLIVLISEIGKRNGLLASILASVPLVSFLAIIWLYFETKDIPQIRRLSTDIFWLVLPSLSFFILFPWLLKRHIAFGWAMLLATVVMVILYFLMILALKKIGVNHV